MAFNRVGMTDQRFPERGTLYRYPSDIQASYGLRQGNYLSGSPVGRVPNLLAKDLENAWAWYRARAGALRQFLVNPAATQRSSVGKLLATLTAYALPLVVDGLDKAIHLAHASFWAGLGEKPQAPPPTLRRMLDPYKADTLQSIPTSNGIGF
jgi:hypothetical protein